MLRIFNEILNKTLVKKIICFVFGMLSTIALSSKVILVDSSKALKITGSENYTTIFIAKIRMILESYGLVWTLLAILLSTLYYKEFFINKISFKKSVFIPSLLFSIFMIFGASFKALGNWNYIFGNEFQMFWSIIVLLGFIILFYVVINKLFETILYYGSCKLVNEHGENINSKLDYIFNKHCFCSTFLIILILGIPYVICFFPGAVQWDGMRQLNYFYGISKWTNHHPAFSTIIIGSCMKLGRMLGSDNFGVFIYTFIQFIISSLMLAYCFVVMKKLKTPYWIRIITLIYFSVFTFWPINAYTLVKDTSYYLTTLGYLFLIISFVNNSQKFILDKKRVILFGILMTFICLLRNNGIYVVVITAPFLILVCNNKKSRWIMGRLVVVVVICFKLFNIIVLPIMNISDGSKREALSIPFQQTARYVLEYKNEVTDKEKEIISKILDYDKLGQLYNGEISDPVKATFNDNATNEELLDYFQVWIKQFFKHPGVYLQATINNTYGYFYPDKMEYNSGLGAAYSIAKDKQINTGEFDINFLNCYSDERNIIWNFAYILRSLPVIGILYSNGTYTWILILCISLLIYKRKYKSIVVLIPSCAILLICVASPVNVIRYMLPVIVATPINIAWTLYSIKKD